MSVVGLIVHRERALQHGQRLANALVKQGHQVRFGKDSQESTSELAPQTSDNFGDGLDLVVTLGGDGSILRAVELLAGAKVPILGVNHGRLGYLTQVAPQETQEAISKALAGNFNIEERMLLRTKVSAGGVTTSHLALNETVLERAAEVNTVRIEVHIDGEFFTTYVADGLIMATPTGSTAYAFAARGPIIEPTHRALLLAPVSPHMAFDRALVFAADSCLRFVVDGHRRAVVAVDGKKVAVVGDGDAIECSLAHETVNLVIFGKRRFHRILKAKFGLNDR